jgi:hypothetical protein
VLELTPALSSSPGQAPTQGGEFPCGREGGGRGDRHVHFHYTPTHASWLNQIECWFSILSRQALQGASFTSVAQLRQALDKFVASYNETATPFEWTKRVVKPGQLKHRYSDLYN